MKMKNRLPIWHINLGTRKNSPRSRHEYGNYKKYLSIMMLICIKQQVSKIWNSIHNELKQHLGWDEKTHCL